jgi:hypothetical protein
MGAGTGMGANCHKMTKMALQVDKNVITMGRMHRK